MRVWGHLALLPIFLVPPAAARLQDRTIDGGSPAAVSKGLNQRHQMPAHTADLRRQAVGQAAQALHFSRRLFQPTKQFMDGMQMTHNHDDQRFEKQALRVEARSTGSAPEGGEAEADPPEQPT